MALPHQRRKHAVILQPRKLRLRLVQMAPTMVTGPAVAAGATTIQLTFMPPSIGPNQLWVLGGANQEIVSVKSVNVETNEVTLAAATTKEHKPGLEDVPLMPAGCSYKQVWGATGTWYWASWAGLNGKSSNGKGWEQGNYTRSMIEEGQGEFTFPNAAGSDGVRHLDRFLILNDENYRVGDEWIELWAASSVEGTAGDLLFIGTPYQAEMNPTEITLSLVDGQWCLKKQRESNAGFWTNAPRDVFEEYSKQMQVFCADGFDTPLNFPSTPTNHAETSDKRWEASNTIASPVSSNVRILPRGATDSFLRYKKGIEIGTSEGGIPWSQSQETHEIRQRRWRLETNFTVPTGEVPQLALELVPASWTYSGPNTISLRFSGTGGTLKSGGAEQNIQKSSANSALFGAGNHTFAIEGRGRWVFFYADGILLGVLPTPRPTQELFPQITFYAEASTPLGYGSKYVDIDYVLMREAVPFLMQGTVKGDYALPGTASGSGLKGEYFSDSDISADAYMGGKQLAPLRQPYATRVDTTLNFGPGEWWPAGVIESQNFSVRWTGAIYLDLSNFDYSLFTEGYAGCRLWIGRTRWSENVIESWQTEGHGNEWFIVNGASGRIEHVKGSEGSPGPLYGQKSGWFPIIVEYQMGNTPSLTFPPKPIFALTYIRSDTGIQVPVNAGAYAHTVRVDAPWWYWPLDNTSFNGEWFNYGSISGFAVIAWVGNSAVNEVTPGPVPNDLAFKLPGETTTVTKYAKQSAGSFGTTGWTGITVEAWVNPMENPWAASQQVIVNSPTTFQLSLGTTGKLQAFIGAGGALWGTSIESPEVIPAGVWTHVAMTYDGTNLRLYVNGVLKATSGTITGQFGTDNTHEPGLGYWPGGGAGAHEKSQFNGAIAHLAVYKNSALSAARLLAHVEAVAAPVELNGGQMTSVSYVPLSPQGVFHQQVRSESHYELVRQFAEEWGLQWTVVPQSLESGLFPGLMVPKIEQGRSTDFVIDEDTIQNPTVKLLADDTADTLILEAQGLASPENSGQLTAEIFNFFSLSAHALTNTEFDSPGDIQVVEQLIRRGESLLALRSAPWEEVGAVVQGRRTLTDTFPLTGALAEFAWEPGDGVRVELPSLGVEDVSTRQMFSISWPVFPDGIAAPTPKFKARPRSVQEAIRHVITALRNQTKNYQGQFAISDGSIGGRSFSEGVYSALGAAPDGSSRVTLPQNFAKIRAAYVSVQTLVATNMTWTLFINGVSTGIVVKAVGPINVMAYIGRDAETSQRMYATLEGTNTGGTPHTGSYTIKLELQVII